MPIGKNEDIVKNREMKITHFCHEHPLVLVNLKIDPKAEVRRDDKCCYVCGNFISEPKCYGCSMDQCRSIFLHIGCANLPREIKHPIHSGHPLILLDKPLDTDCFCSFCGKILKALTFNCFSCKFDLCIGCAHLVLQKRRLKHRSHPHLLTFMQRPVNLYCDACDDKNEDLSFSCDICPFWIHRTCAFLPSTKKYDDHEHPLSLAYNLPLDLHHYHFTCDVCRRPLNPSRWFYQCSPCRHFVHVKCLQTRTNPARARRPISSANKRESEQLDDLELKPLPWTDMSADVIKPFLEKKCNLEIQLVEEINHFSHEHQLILSTAQIGKEESEEEMLCDACVEQISTPYYTCAQCHFFLHLSCASLPAELNHHSHPEHQLSLRKLEKNNGYFYCKLCHMNCNGFFFECEPCKFRIDLHCAILPRIIIYETHGQHLLQQKYKVSRESCDACGKNLVGLIYSCVDCSKFSLHYQCAIMPPIVPHRWEKHCLTLMYPPFGDHPDEFYCEICEEEIHPKYWLYHCKECDQSFHLSCIPRLGKERFMKFGNTLEVSDHQHLLTSIRESRYKSSCSRCSTSLSGQKSFECGRCKFFVCYQCACNVPPAPLPPILPPIPPIPPTPRTNYPGPCVIQ